MMKTVLFYFSKGARLRVKIIKLIEAHNRKNTPIFLNVLAKKLRISHVAMKKHLDLLVEHGYVKPINPAGKPTYLELTKKGREIVEEFTS